MLATVAVTAMAMLLAACGGTDGDDQDDQVRRAEARVTAEERALAEAEAELLEATRTFCEATTEYVVSLDRYGDVLTATAPTVGDVKEAGDDLSQPREDTLEAAEDAVDAQEKAASARQELTAAQAELKTVKSGKEPPSPTPTKSAAPLAPPATVNRVKQAESEFEVAQSGIGDETPLSQASREFNAAAVALEMSWLQLFAAAGCLTDDQQKSAADAVRGYTRALQDALATAGYYDGGLDGVYGPETVAAVESLQQTHGLPVTGTVDKATAAALQGDVLAAGGEVAQQELVTTAALQQTLELAGFWDGPVDGMWTPALTAALEDFQTELGVKPTGVVDAATVAAFEEAIAKARQPDAPSASPSPSPAPEAESPDATQDSS